jgi:membrane-associated phospholipid phosphatase
MKNDANIHFVLRRLCIFLPRFVISSRIHHGNSRMKNRLTTIATPDFYVTVPPWLGKLHGIPYKPLTACEKRVVLDSPVHLFPRRALITAILILSGLFILTLGVMPWDLALSTSTLKLRIPGDLRRLLQFGEVFAHSLGCTVIFGSLLWIDVKNRSKLWRAAAFVVVCAVTANAAKYMIPRYRPYTYKELFPDSSWETFGSPLTQSWFDESLRSFPSGHAATAAAMAIGLSYVYPKGRWLFLSLALLAIAQRLFAAAHYASDLFGGITITIAILFAWIWLGSRTPRKQLASGVASASQDAGA